MTGPFVYEITHFGLVTILISEKFEFENEFWTSSDTESI